MSQCKAERAASVGTLFCLQQQGHRGSHQFADESPAPRPMVTDREAAEWLSWLDGVAPKPHPITVQGMLRALLADRSEYLRFLVRAGRFMGDGDIALRLNRESDLEELIELRAESDKDRILAEAEINGALAAWAQAVAERGS